MKELDIKFKADSVLPSHTVYSYEVPLKANNRELSIACDHNPNDRLITGVIQALFYYSRTAYVEDHVLIVQVSPEYSAEDLNSNMWNWLSNGTINSNPNKKRYYELMSVILELKSKGADVKFV